jgi:3-hydroxybutyryl-CoA dehydrogenase
MSETPIVGVVGLGFLGRGIVACMLGYGARVVAFDRDRATLEPARNHIQGAMNELVDLGGFDSSLRNQWPGRFTEAASIADLTECRFVIESVVESVDIKAKVFDELESAVAAEVPIASNTSALPITLLQRGRKHPQRFVGMHWGEPCHVARFLEVIAGEQTSPQTIDQTMSLGKRVGKDPVLVRKDIEGFIANRLGYAMIREAFHLLEQGVGDADTIDRAFRNSVGMWAMFAGPFRWMDLTGLPGYANVMARLFPLLSSQTDVPASLRELVKSGAKGVSNHQGFFDYDDAEAQRWQKLFHDHVWAFRKLSDSYFGGAAHSPSPGTPGRGG